MTSPMIEIEVDGVLRDVGHLAPSVVTIAGKRRNDGDLRARTSLSLHTISEGCKWDGHNLVDENEKPRRFCEDRYAFSPGLPNLARRMIEQNYFCWRSTDRHRAINYTVIDVAPRRVRLMPDGRHHMMFFYLYPCRSDAADVNLVITSCHQRDIKLSRIVQRFNLIRLLRTCLFSGKRIP